MINNVDVDEKHKDGHAENVDGGHTARYADAHTCYDVVSRSTII